MQRVLFSNTTVTMKQPPNKEPSIHNNLLLEHICHEGWQRKNQCLSTLSKSFHFSSLDHATNFCFSILTCSHSETIQLQATEERSTCDVHVSICNSKKEHVSETTKLIDTVELFFNEEEHNNNNTSKKYLSSLFSKLW